MDRRLVLLVAGLALLSRAPLGSAETIRFKDGVSIQAKIVERRDDAIVIEWNGRLYTYRLDEVASIGDEPMPKVPADFNIMKGILFLNANQANNGSASFNDDWENNMLEYFDADGRLMERSHIDADNDIVTQRFDKDGKVVSEIKITDESVMAGIKQNEVNHQEKEVPALKAQLAALSLVAEQYAKAHGGKYPRHMRDLMGADPPYLTDCPCDRSTPTYGIVCDVNETGYRFKADARWGHLESYVVSTGGTWEELGPRNPKYEKSTSPCN